MDNAVVVAVPDMAVHTRLFGLGSVDPPNNVVRRINKLLQAGSAERQHHFIRHLILRLIGGLLLRFGTACRIVQADADTKGLVDVVHHIIIQTAHIVPQPAFVNRPDLLQHGHRTLGQAKIRRDTDVRRLAEFFHPGGDGGDDDGRAITSL